MNRIEMLRNEALNNDICYDEFFYGFYKFLGETNDLPSFEEYGNAFYHALSNITPSISNGELIVGKCNRKIADSETEWHNTYSKLARDMFKKAGGGQDSHMAIDYELLLEYGINGIINKIDAFLAECDESKKPFYKSCKRCLEGVMVFSENYSLRAKKMAEEENDPQRKNELEKISEICKKVPAYPAESFYEAVQSVHFVTLCISMNPFRFGCAQQFQLGHPDRYLMPFYEKDLSLGAITKDEAQDLLDCLGIQINNRVPNGLSSGYMVGGRYENDRVVANDLTKMLMQVVDDIRLVYPAVGLCYTEDMGDEYVEKACEILSRGCSHPAIFGDDTITKGLIDYGVDVSEARNYIHSTCVEITPVGASNVWVASPYTNMALLLLEILDREYETFESLLEKLFESLDEKIRNNYNTRSDLRRHRVENSMNPLLSCFVNDCLKKGTDIEKGGAKYNWILPSFVGVANLVDSLIAIKEIVFDSKELTIAEFKRILDVDFENNEAFRVRLLNKLPKYGNDIDEVDSYFEMITSHIVGECKKHSGFLPNSQLIPSVFCWVMHERFGKETGATPDGRKAGEPFAPGANPMHGRDAQGALASLNSVAKLNYDCCQDGISNTFSITPETLGADDDARVENLTSVLDGYFVQDAHHLNVNVLNRQKLIDAMNDPTLYPSLTIRVSGYAVNFNKLTKDKQLEVISRTFHEKM